MTMGRALLALLLIFLSCGHTHSVKQQGSEASSAREGERKAGAKSEESDRGTSGKSSQGAERAPLLATSPAGLLQPGAIAALQDKLVDRGYLDKSARSDKLDDRTEKALRDFQRDQGLPATGTPDDATVKKLGLSLQDVFRSAPSGKP